MSTRAQAGMGNSPMGGCQEVIAQGDGWETLRSDWWKPLICQRLLFWQEVFWILWGPLFKVDHSHLITRLFLAVGIHSAVKGSDDVINFRAVPPAMCIPAVMLLIGPLFFFPVFAEDLIECAETPLLLWGSTVLGRKGLRRLCSMRIWNNNNSIWG